ncbi:phage major capsid protein [Mycolicibacter sp. MYC123]|uniref:Phage major capsid protein n=1 Tax=[Mycobacterium] zoologicum TaxID=2872311 RepID=A0ABU5YG28_9MYCO|nr:phage major capsid protein [Mycolicibacter sp. MYC123]MEB3048995.1 phage major capsid protein [Mycolicibacter sp. MYC123]
MNKIEIDAKQRELNNRKKILQADLVGVKSGNASTATLKSLQTRTDSVIAEQAELDEQRAIYDKAMKMVDFGNAIGHDGAATETKTNTNFSADPRFIPESDWRGLYEASVKRLPSYRVDIKSPFGEGNFTSGSLPPVMLPRALELPYEPDRLLDHFIQETAPTGPGVEWVSHTGNQNTAGVVAELGEKPDLGMILTTNTASWVKIAATASVSMEAASDFKTFQSFVPGEIYRAIVDKETDTFVNDANHGLLHVSGTLTRAVGSDTSIDAIRKAANDIRVGAAFGEANLIAMNPATWSSVSLSKSSTGQYLLSPDDPSAIGDLKSIFGMTVVQNTHIPAGTALVFDTRKAVLRWVRWGFSLEINSQGSDGTTNFWTQNAIGYRGEIREQIGVQYASAINILTGLPTS